MTYRIELTASAKRALKVELPEAAAVAGRYSARRGEFRVIYQVFEDRVVVRVINIDHRRDIYR